MGQLGNSPFPFDVIIAFMWMTVFLFLGLFIRKKIKFLGVYMVPACMSGGIIGLILVSSGLFNGFGVFTPNPQMIQMIIFHLFGISFICFGLNGFGGSSLKKIAGGAYLLSFSTAGVSALYITIISACIYIWNMLFGTQFMESMSYLLSQGFIGGPGLAMGTGVIWEQAGHAGMISVALAFAAMGFVMSILVGVPLANYALRKTGKKKTELNLSPVDLTGIYGEEGECPEAGRQTIVTSNMDTMTFHIGIVIFCYFIAFAIMQGLRFVLPPLWQAILWSVFAPFICMPVALFFREVFVKRIIKQDCLIDRGTSQRILGVALDYMAVGALISVEIKLITDFLPLIAVTSIVAGLTVALYLWWIFRTVKDFPAERLLGVYGCATGTVTSGLVLIRMLDPNFKSSAAIEVGLLGVAGLTMMPITAFTMAFPNAQALTGESPLVFVMLCGVAFLIAYTILAKYVMYKMHDYKKPQF